MHPPARLGIVAVRACALAAVATAFGVIGHVHAGGSGPGLTQVLGLWLAAAALSFAFLMREVGWIRIAVLLLGEQLLVHASLMWVVDNHGSPMSAMAGMPGMPAMAGMSGMSGMSAVPSPTMIAAHGLAAMVAGLWLWRGECALWALLTLAGESLQVLLRRMAIRPLTQHRLPTLRVVGFRSLWGMRIAREIPRRGPPRLATL